jgi:hypothetical protein
MSKEVAKAKNSALAAAQALKGNLQKAKRNIPEAGNSSYMRFGKDGAWTFGVDNDELVPEDRIAINPMSIKTGWSCWTDRDDRVKKKNELMGEAMFPLGADVTPKHELPKHKDPLTDEPCDWREQTSVVMRVLDGPHKGKQIEYSTTSVGGNTALSGLVDQIMLQLDEDPENIVPVVSLDSDSYMHKRWGKTYVPILKVTGFVSMDDQPEINPETPDDDDEDAADDIQQDEDGDVIDGTAEEIEEEEEAEEEAEEEPKPRRRRRR